MLTADPMLITHPAVYQTTPQHSTHWVVTRPLYRNFPEINLQPAANLHFKSRKTSIPNQGAHGARGVSSNTTYTPVLPNLTSYNVASGQLFNFTNFTSLASVVNGSGSGNLTDLEGEESEESAAFSSNFEKILSIVVPVIFGIIVIIGLIGNSMVVLVIFRKKHFRSATNFMIANLAVADLSFVLICVPFTGTQYALGLWPFSGFWCRFVQYMINVCAYASVYTLVAMSVIRYIVVVYPMKSMYLCTINRTLRIIAAIWIGSFGLNVPVTLLYKKFEYDFEGEHRSACVMITPGESLKKAQIFYALFFLGTFVIPITAICILYVILIRALWDKSKLSGDNSRYQIPGVKVTGTNAKRSSRGRGSRTNKHLSGTTGIKLSALKGMTTAGAVATPHSKDVRHPRRKKSSAINQLAPPSKMSIIEHDTFTSFSAEVMNATDKSPSAMFLRLKGGARGKASTSSCANDMAEDGNAINPILILNKSGNRSHLKNKKKVTRLTVTVVVVFAMCWLPIHIMLMVQFFATRELSSLFQPLLLAANCLAYMNSCVNPILYSFLSRSFYGAFLDILCPCVVARRKSRLAKLKRTRAAVEAPSVKSSREEVGGTKISRLSTNASQGSPILGKRLSRADKLSSPFEKHVTTTGENNLDPSIIAEEKDETSENVNPPLPNFPVPPSTQKLTARVNQRDGEVNHRGPDPAAAAPHFKRLTFDGGDSIHIYDIPDKKLHKTSSAGPWFNVNKSVSAPCTIPYPPTSVSGYSLAAVTADTPPIPPSLNRIYSSSGNNYNNNNVTPSTSEETSSSCYNVTEPSSSSGNLCYVSQPINLNNYDTSNQNPETNISVEPRGRKDVLDEFKRRHKKHSYTINPDPTSISLTPAHFEDISEIYI